MKRKSSARDRFLNSRLYLSKEQIAAHDAWLDNPDNVMGPLQARLAKPSEVYIYQRTAYNRLWRAKAFECHVAEVSPRQLELLRKHGVCALDDWRVIKKFGFGGGKPNSTKGGAHLHRPRKGRPGRGRGARIVTHRGILEGYYISTDGKPYKRSDSAPNTST